jgi:hypothetical protein
MSERCDKTIAPGSASVHKPTCHRLCLDCIVYSAIIEGCGDKHIPNNSVQHGGNLYGVEPRERTDD